MKRHQYSLLFALFIVAPDAFAQLRTESLPSLTSPRKEISAADWASIRQQYEHHRHTAVPVDGGHQASNPGQQWQTHFDGRGFITTPDAGGWKWGLELHSYGFPGYEQGISEHARVSSAGHRVAYDWNDNLQEWFINDTRGLEHGFTLRNRPTGTGDQLLLNITVRGGLHPKVQADGRGVCFVDTNSAGALTYTGLKAFDADGRTLPARFEPVEEGLRLAIDERAARYPLTIDPIAQQAYIKASNTGLDDYFGSSVAISGDTMVIGAPGEDSSAAGVNGNQASNTAGSAGAAYVFVRNGTTWSQQAYLKASNTGAGDLFGNSVAVSGDTIVVGAPYEASGATGVNGNQNDESAQESGAAYVFVRSGTTWSQQAYLKASNTDQLSLFGDHFGSSVAVSGNTVVVGAYAEDSNATGVNGNQSDNSALDSGAAYVFVRSGTTWSQQAYLKASNTGRADNFGVSVSVSGNTVVVGAHQEGSSATGVNGDQSNNSALLAGAAYVFERSGTTWSQQAYLKASNTGAGDAFGFSVAIAGDTAVVGAIHEDSNATGVNGNQGDNTATDSGAAYIFVRSGTVWSQQAYLKASNTGGPSAGESTGDQFGGSVAISANTVVIGAVTEDSNAVGVGGDGSNNNALDSGAAYVFVRSGTTWTQQAYLKASNTGGGVLGGGVGANGDFFGDVAVSGDTVVVGARFEDSNATGVNGDQSNENARYSGAAYVFSGLGVIGPEIAVEQPSGNDLTDGSANVAFGDVIIGGSSQRIFTIRNIGTINLTGLGITIDGPNGSDFTVIVNASAPVTPGGSTTLTVRFAPGVAGARTAALHITSDDSDESPFDIALAGTGVTPMEIAQQAYLKASNTDSDDRFGHSVAISGDTVVVGAWLEDSNATGVNGNQSNNTGTNSGAVYVFVRNGSTWTQQAYLKTSSPGQRGQNDSFGISVAILGDTLVVGADGESSNATGVNGNQNDNSASASGAAYVFVRNGTTWTQQAYLKASNTDAIDSFGLSVAVSGDTVVVGAPWESSNATGINGNQSNNTATNSGAAYVFVRTGTNWAQQAYLKASNTGGPSLGETLGDFFGYAVAISANTIVIGAPNEDSNATGVNGNQSNNTATNSGAAYVFVRSGTTWTQQAYLKASNTGTVDLFGDGFGASVTISGDTAVIGAPGEDSDATGVNSNQNDEGVRDAGAAYVFVRSGTTWSQQAYLKASNSGRNDEFGNSVSAWGDTIIVGALQEDSSATGVNGNQNNDNATYSGAAYVFVRSGAIWTQHGYLKASNAERDDNFGYSVAVSGNTMVVGAHYEHSNATGVNGDQNNNNARYSGAAYVFTFGPFIPDIAVEQPLGNGLIDGSATVNFGNGLLGADSQRTFTVRNAGNGHLTGLGITITGVNATDFAVTANPTAPLAPDGSTTFTVTFTPQTTGNKSAALHIASNDGDESPFDIALIGTGLTALQMAPRAYLKASNTGAGDFFGFAVAISGDTIVIGAQGEDGDTTGVNGPQNNNNAVDSGAAYVFVRSGTNWAQQAYLKASNADPGDRFGYSVAISGNTIVVGAIRESSSGAPADNRATNAGAAYVFVRSGTNWTQQAYLKASNAEAEDWFGYSVSVSGNFAVVGAVFEDSNATGINGDQNNNTATNAGAAYVFVRSGTTWTQQAYLKASNTEADDSFGRSVAISGSIVLVGAPYEDSIASGVNGDDNNNLGLDSGAAYVFVRSGAIWSQRAYLKASNTDPGDLFGYDVTISGNSLVVSAPAEDSSATGVNGNQADDSAPNSGAAYVFVPNGTTWSQQAYLKASNTGAGDQFGISVSGFGNTVVVGAFSEDSNATGVNGDQSDSSASGAGAAYVFLRTGTTWTQQAYLKASNTGAGDNFGISASVSGDTVVVGAVFEDSNATGINGNQNNNIAVSSGAAYVFTGLGPGPLFSSLSAGSTGVFINFAARAGLTYFIQRATDPSGPWSTIAMLTADDSGPLEYHDTTAPHGRAFYRTMQP